MALLPRLAAPLRLDVNAAAIRLEGPAISVARRLDDLRALLAKRGGAFETLPQAESAALWRALRDAAPVAGEPGRYGAYRSRPPTVIALVAGLREAEAPLLAHFYDWAGGLVWLCFEPAPDAHAALLRTVIGRLGGHATLIRASAEVRAAVDVFRAATAGAGGADAEGEGKFRPRAYSGARPPARGVLTRCKRISHWPLSPTPTWRGRKRFCAPACIAAFAPRPARRFCSPATNSIRRAGASI